MNVNYNDVNLGFIGDIHGDFQKLQQLVKPFTDTVFIILGDSGFGFPDTKEDKIKKMLKANFNVFLEKRNLYLLFIRGNHDDPSYFSKLYDRFTDRFVLVPDYTLITVNNTNILCIGGAVSVDRRFRKVDSSYWYNEEMHYFENYLYKDIGVDIIAAHTVDKSILSYCLPVMPEWLKKSYQVDKKLKLDSIRESEICQNLYLYYKPKVWIHGHYHISNRINGDVKIISLKENELYEYREF
jgi:predicted phosphodiesterase